ncbi:MAG: metallophosphoesterase [Clostridia bacterium]|nr:metallophosphoesterase [Clostridia bacterium]
MSFLKFKPCVFVVDDEYEILVVANKNAILAVEIAGEEYDEDNSGVLSSEKDYARIRVPQDVLNAEKSYTVVYREAIDRKGYFSEIGERQKETFEFKPLTKTKDIHIYHIGDVHYGYDFAKLTANYFGDDTDLFIFNGDIGEVETVKNYHETIEYVSEVTEGKIPAIFTRGNHDARGKLAERYTDYFPSNGKKTYYTFSIGCLNGVVLDCGEDKKDDHYDKNYPMPWVYNGVNKFSKFRKKQAEWLKNLELENDGKITFAISHICPVLTTKKHGSCFDIERETYGEWAKELERLGIKFMVTAHKHHCFIADKDFEFNTQPHTYPVIVGSRLYRERYVRREGDAHSRVVVDNFYGAAITVNPGKIEVKFTDQNHDIYEDKVYTLEI